MSAADDIRASHQDRESTAEVLRQAYTAGRLDLAELRERTGAAYSARTWGELRRLTADLPAGPDLSAGVSPAGHRPLHQAGESDLARGRPATPLLVMAFLWLGIAATAQAPQALLLALVLLAIWAIWAVAWRLPGDARDVPPATSGRPGTGKAGPFPGRTAPGSRQAGQGAGQAAPGSGHASHRRLVTGTERQPACRSPRPRCRSRSPARRHPAGWR